MIKNLTPTEIASLYKRWTSLIARCDKPITKQYKDYGGRGIGVCPEWRDFDVFCYWADDAGFSIKLHLDRIDVDGDYAPENCRFVTQLANNRNRRTTLRITAFGETKTIVEWMEDPRCVLTDYHSILFRFRKGWEPERCLSEPELESIHRYIEGLGERKTVKAWSKDPRCHAPYKLLHARLQRGVPLEKAMEAAV